MVADELVSAPTAKSLPTIKMLIVKHKPMYGMKRKNNHNLLQHLINNNYKGRI